MKQLILILAGLFCFNLHAQINSALNELVINVTASTQINPPAITLHWSKSTATGTTYRIDRKIQGINRWSLITNTALTDSTHTDTNVREGQVYEYRVTKVNVTTTVSWGYTSAGIHVLPYMINRGLILVLDTSITNSIPTKIQRYKDDLQADGYFITEIQVDRNDAVADVKLKIKAAYEAATFNYQTTIILGNVPVPYSGNLNPDAHPDHKGAWSTDLFYADINGLWTDVSVNSTPGGDSRTDNIPGDGKYDQSTVPSKTEMEIGRIDFHSMSWFSETEQELLENYLDKNHAFRNKQFVPGRKGLMDEGGFANSTAGEGFGQSAPRAMVPLLGQDSLILGDYFGTLSQESHLWSYGQGGGSYTSCGGVGTTRDFDTIEVQSVFTMLFGSYFGDYDKPNNLMRASLGSGTVLTCSWSSARPIWYYHHMAMGQTIGYSARQSLNIDDQYIAINFGAGFPTNNGVHNVLLGDPTLRAFYVTPPGSLTGSPQADGKVNLSWAASTDADLAGYNLYRSEQGAYRYSKVNEDLILTPNFTDSLGSGDYSYFLRAVKLETTASGVYYNESLGVFDDVSVLNTVGNDPLLTEIDIRIFPNPVSDKLSITSNMEVSEMSITDIHGREIIAGRSFPVNIASLADGVYILHAQTKYGIVRKKFVKE